MTKPRARNIILVLTHPPCAFTRRAPSLIISQSEIVKTSYEKSSGNESEIAKSERDLIGYIHVVRQSGLHNCVNNITKFTHDNGNRNGMCLAL